ncbi:hypothetical protein PENSPDRAFT_453782 [Peniophora sp. CONT]|nr:hypothetical protein PENSPDRAFT_453782 [Peniophora sp. CONT]
MDPIYLDGEARTPAEDEPMDYEEEEDEEEDQLMSDVDEETPAAETPVEETPAPPPPPPKPRGEELEPSDDEAWSTPVGTRQKGAKPGVRTPGVSLFDERRVNIILEENGSMTAMSKEALWVLSVATEEFIRRYAQAGNDVARTNDRSIIQYGDLAQSTSMRCFSMLEDVVPITRPLHKAVESREKFLKRQHADNPALIASKEEAAPHYDPSTPLVPYPAQASTPWDVTPNGTPAPGGSKRTKSAPKKDKDPNAPAAQPRKSTSAVKTDAEKEAERERRSARQRDKAGRFSQGGEDATSTPAPPTASAPPAATAAAAPAAAGNGAFGPFGTTQPQADEGAPFATNTGRTIYSQR